MANIRSYAAVKSKMLRGRETAEDICRSFKLAGTEIYFDDLVPRDETLFNNAQEKARLARAVRSLCAGRGHASYWAWPTAFLTGRHRDELVRNFGGEAAVRAYYGDLTGERIFSRWVSEYAFAADMGFSAYTFHMIDYAPIDGLWEFTLSRDTIADAMGEILSVFCSMLEDRGLLSASSPLIELENAGWGLEYGAQTARDFVKILGCVDDRHHRLRIAWDTNHLLHAMGVSGDGYSFLLPENEISDEMRTCLNTACFAPEDFLRMNILSAELRGRIGSVHLSDRVLPDRASFIRGRMTGPESEHLDGLLEWEARESYGEGIVLDKYDSHLPLGEGCLSGDIAGILNELNAENPDFCVLHELKNSADLRRDLEIQLRKL